MGEVRRVQVLGLCRFSYPGELKGFQTRHKTMDERLAHLYSPRRLEARFFFLEHLLLPGIRHQTNDDFTLLLLMGDSFPKMYRERLLTLVADVPQIKPIFREPGPHRQVYRDLFLEARDHSADVVAEFRLDDDDAVAVNYVQTIRRLLPNLRPLFSNKGRLALDQGRGILVHADETGIAYTPLVARFWSPALTLFFKPDDGLCVMDFPHQRVWQRLPTVTLSDQLMFLRGMHATNDSAIWTKGAALLDLERDEIKRRMKKRFAVDAAAFEDGWARMIELS